MDRARIGSSSRVGRLCLTSPRSEPGASGCILPQPAHSPIAALFPSVDGWIDPFGKQLLGIIALDARVRERSDRILA
jgi:hypothetical protein